MTIERRSPTVVEEKRRGREDRISIIRAEKNGGPAMARNIGLAASTGEWIAVIDADDAWREDRLELLISALHQTSADGICDNLVGFDERSSEPEKTLFNHLPAVLDVTAVVASQYGGSYNLGYLKPVVRRSFLKEHQIGYNEELRSGEDLVYLLDILVRRGNIVCRDLPTYIYTLPTGNSGSRRSQSTTIPLSDEALSRSLRSVLDRHAHNLTSGECRAFEERIIFLNDISPISEFRRARLLGDWRKALKVFLTETSVRRRLLDRAMKRVIG